MSALTLNAGDSIAGVAGSATSITITIFGDEKTTTDDFKVIYQGQLPAVAATLYGPVTVGSQTIVSTITLANTTGGAVTATLFVNGTAAANRVVSLTVPAGGSASWGGDGWKVLDSAGSVLTTYPVTLTGDVTGSGTGTIATTLATVNANVGTFGTASSVAQVTENAKGLTTAASNVPIQIVPAAVTGFDTQVRTNRLDQMAAPTGSVSFNSQKITSVADAANGTDVPNFAQVQAIAEGRDDKEAVEWGTTAPITLLGLGTQVGGEWTGALLVTDRVLVKDQALTQNDGIYTPSAGAWTRTLDANTGAEITNATVLVEQGATLKGDTWRQSAVVTTIGTDPQTWVQIGEGDPISLTNVGAVPNAQGASLAGQALTLQPANGSFPGLLSAAGFTNLGNQSGTNSGDVTLTNSGAVANAAGASLAGQALTLQPASASFAGLLTAAQFTKLANTSNTNSGDVTLAAVGAVPNANAATLAGQQLNLQPASASFPGVITSAQFVILSNTSGTNTGNVSLGAVGASPNANGATLTGQALNLELASASFPGLITATQFTKLANTSGTNTGDQNLFASVTGNTGTATADTTTDSLAITGSGVISTAATDTPDGLVITSAALTGDVTTVGAAATIANDVVTNAKLANMSSATFKGQTSGGSGDPVDLTAAQAKTALAIANTDVSGLGTLATVSNLTGPVTSVGAATAVTNNAITNAMLAQAPTLTLKGNNTGGTANVTDLTLTQLAAMGVTGLSRWIDVTKQATPVLTTNTAAQNITAINAILAAADAGSTIYIPGGTYNFNAAWTMPSKQFVFQGQGSNLTGGYTILAWTSNVAGNFITLANSIWYTQFRDLNFVSAGVTQTAGAVVDINGNAGTNFFNCSFSTTGGGFLFDVLKGDKVGTGIQDQSWNSAVISGCAINSFKGKAIFVNSAASSLVVEKCVINGAWGGFTGSPAALQATAGIEGRWVGALQVIACDILGCVNNLLLDPVSASSEVCASVVVTNCYFDNAGGSCVKVTGTGSTVRCRFTACYFTTAGTNYSTPGTGLSAIEINGTATYIAGGQSIAFTDCNIYDTFSTAGSPNGVLIAGNWADVYFNGCNISGWTNGFNVTPTAGNISNLKVTGGACGPSGGLGNNVVGFLIGAGAYKGLQIQTVNAAGNGTNLTLGAVTVPAGEGSQFRITDNTGINPRAGELRPVNPPVAGTTYTNTSGFRVQVMHKNSAAPTAVTINGTLYTVAFLLSQVFTVYLEPGGTIAFTGGTHTSWSWIGQ